MLPRHFRCVLSRLRCNGHSLMLSSYLFRIGRIENPFCSACEHSSQDTSSHSALSSYGLFAPLTLWRFSLSLSLSLRPLVQTVGSCPACGAPWSSTMPPFPQRGGVINNNCFEMAYGFSSTRSTRSCCSSPTHSTGWRNGGVRTRLTLHDLNQKYYIEKEMVA